MQTITQLRFAILYGYTKVCKRKSLPHIWDVRWPSGTPWLEDPGLQTLPSSNQTLCPARWASYSRSSNSEWGRNQNNCYRLSTSRENSVVPDQNTQCQQLLQTLVNLHWTEASDTYTPGIFKLYSASPNALWAYITQMLCRHLTKQLTRVWSVKASNIDDALL